MIPSTLDGSAHRLGPHGVTLVRLGRVPGSIPLCVHVVPAHFHHTMSLIVHFHSKTHYNHSCSFTSTLSFSPSLLG